MIRYLLRRIVYGFLILLGVNLLTFLIFFAVNTPDDMARIAIGGKYVSAEAIADWKHVHGYDKPLICSGWISERATGAAASIRKSRTARGPLSHSRFRHFCSA